MPEAKSSRQLSYADALLEAQAIVLERDRSVYIVGLGVPDPKGIFGSTLGLQQRFGAERVMDMPLAENAMTGVMIGWRHRHAADPHPSARRFCDFVA